MTVRIAVACALSLLLTGGLFGFLNAVTGERFHAIRVHAPMRVEPPRLVDRPPPPEPIHLKPDPPKAQPGGRRPILDLPPAIPSEGPVHPVPLEFPSGPDSGDGIFDPSLDPGPGREGAAAQRSAIPLIRIEPEYPPQAAERGLEGWVVVQFTIAADGRVREAAAIQSSDPIFEREALRAVERFHYQPQIEGGRAVEVVQKLTLRFSLGD